MLEHELIFRTIFFSVFICTVGISGYYRKKARESETISRSREGGLVLAGRLLLGLTLLVIILSYTFAPGWISWSMISIPQWLRWVGVILAIFCPFLAVWVFKYIGKNISETVLTKQEHELVTSGPYQWIRHPLYSMGLLLIFSLGLIASNGLLLLFGLIGVIVFRFIVIPAEEKNLIDKFGMVYEEYRSRTGALTPWF